MPKLLKNHKVKRILAIVLSVSIVVSCVAIAVSTYKKVKLIDGGHELVLNTYSTSTERILSQADIKLDACDEVKRKKTDDAILIEVLRAFPVYIKYHNLEYVEFMTKGVVSDVLKKADISLGVDDVINVSGDTKLYDGMKIEIDQVKYITKTETKKIKCDTIYKDSSDYPQGYQEVVAKGKNGKTQTSTTYRYVNGELDGVSSQFKEVIAKPKSKVVVKGTAKTAEVSNIGGVSNQNTSSSSTGTSTAGSVNGLAYSKVLTGSATAYTSSQGALTSTGVPAYVGGVAVNPNVIPYGSKLYIVADGYTYGYATAVDTGGALMSGSALVDLYMSTYDECINFGRRNVKVYVLK